MALRYDVSRAKAKCKLCNKPIGVGEKRAYEVVSFFGNATRHYFHILCAKTELEDNLKRLNDFDEVA